jgi:hypothetical protein
LRQTAQKFREDGTYEAMSHHYERFAEERAIWHLTSGKVGKEAVILSDRVSQKSPNAGVQGTASPLPEPPPLGEETGEGPRCPRKPLLSAGWVGKKRLIY